MFSQEPFGYNRAEVDNFIKRMRAGYEAKLMEEKLKVLEAEKKVLDIKNERVAIENRERNIITALNVIEKATQFNEEGPKKLYELTMDKLEVLVKELSLKFPQLRKSAEFEELLDEFAGIVQSYKKQLAHKADITHPVHSENDSMRMLLNKMRGYKKQEEETKEVYIPPVQHTPPIKKPTQTFVIAPSSIPDSESGFSFEEALNPTEDLEEIMKAFDFYNG